MKWLFISWLALLSSIAAAQESSLIPEQAFGVETVKPIRLSSDPLCFQLEDLESSIKRELVNSCSQLQNAHVDVVLRLKHESLSGYHFTYTQTFKGLEVYGSHVKVNLSKDFRVVDAHALLAHTEHWNALSIDVLNEGQVIYFDGVQPMLAVKLREVLQGATIETLTLQDGEKLYRNITSHLTPVPDTLMKVYVFNPDPLTSTKSKYGGELVDNNDADSDALTNARVMKPVIGKYLSGEFWLENRYVKFVGMHNKNFQPAVSKTHVFDFTRSQPGFEQANIYYHINTLRHYLDSVGLTGLVKYKMEIDPRNDAIGDHSKFIDGPDNTGQMLFGTGGIDDAEDADIIVHEFGHAISYWLNGNKKKGERQAVDEGLSDYFACSYSKAISSFNQDSFANWDGNTAGWQGRSCFSQKVYPNDLEQQVHADGEIFSSALMQIEHFIGRDETHKLLIESMYSYHNGMGLRGAGDYLLKADSLLNKGSNHGFICTTLKDHGLVSICTDGIAEIQNVGVSFSVDQEKFLTYGQVHMEFETPFQGEVRLYNALGQVMYSHRVQHQQKVEIGNVEQSGIYIIQVSSQGLTQSRQIAR